MSMQPATHPRPVGAQAIVLVLVVTHARTLARPARGVELQVTVAVMPS